VVHDCYIVARGGSTNFKICGFGPKKIGVDDILSYVLVRKGENIFINQELEVYSTNSWVDWLDEGW